MELWSIALCGNVARQEGTWVVAEGRGEGERGRGGEKGIVDDGDMRLSAVTVVAGLLE